MRRKLSAATKKDQVSYQKPSLESSQLFDKWTVGKYILLRQISVLFFWGEA